MDFNTVIDEQAQIAGCWQPTTGNQQRPNVSNRNRRDARFYAANLYRRTDFRSGGDGLVVVFFVSDGRAGACASFSKYVIKN
jgi:hypothetical protein